MRRITGLFFAIVLLTITASAQNNFTVYGGAGGGLSRGLGFNQGDFALDGGADIYHKKMFGEAEVGWDSANLFVLQDGTTLRFHALAMYHGKEHWWFGGGVHYAHVLHEPLDPAHEYWPVAAAMYQKSRFRINNEYLFPVGNRFMTGPLCDMRYRVWKGLYYRERFGLFFYHDLNQPPNPPHWRGGEADFGAIYVFHDRREPLQ